MVTSTEPLLTAGQVRDQIDRALRGAFLAAAAEHERSPHAMSMSRLGGCTRAAAYAVAGTEVSDQPTADESRAATLGTWQHAGLLPVLAAQLPGAEYEVPTALRAAGLSVPGTIDLDWDQMVLDVKTVGERRLHGVRRHGAYADHRVQVMGYVLARVQAGRPVRWVVWLYMDRANGDHEIIVEEFTNAAALAVIDRVEEIKHWARQPDKARRDARGPGLSFACDGCAWLKRCWGDDANPGAAPHQRNIVRDDPAVEALLALYDDASERGSLARQDQEFAKACLDATRKGIYGVWSLRRGQPGTYLDEAAVAARYGELGEELPRKTSNGRLLIRLTTALTKKMLTEINSVDVPDVEDQ
jgi:hypothetical protein